MSPTTKQIQQIARAIHTTNAHPRALGERYEDLPLRDLQSYFEVISSVISHRKFGGLEPWAGPDAWPERSPVTLYNRIRELLNDYTGDVDALTAKHAPAPDLSTTLFGSHRQ